MDIKEKWNALLSRLCRLFSLLFRDKGKEIRTETSGELQGEMVQEEVSQAEQEDIAETASPDLVAIIRDRLEYLRQKRIFSIRKKNKRMEWCVSPTDFTDAYLFLLGIPGIDISRLECHRVADYVSYKVAFPESRTIELTDNTQRKSVQALLCLSEGNDCILTIHFIKPLKTMEL